MMKDFLKLAWRDICRTGSYLVVHTQSAAPNLSEQLKKYTPAATITNTLSTHVFGNYTGTAGIYAHQLSKLKLLLDAIYAKSPNEEAALKDFAFALRNMLLHSHYKSVIKSLEKPSTAPQNVHDYFLEIEQFQTAETLDSYTRAKYIFLYSFIKAIIETNKITARRSLTTSYSIEAQAETEDYFDFVTQNNALTQAVQHYMTPAHNEESVQLDELLHYFASLQPEQHTLTLTDNTISAVALLQYLAIYEPLSTEELLITTTYFKKKYQPLEHAFAAFGLHIHEILANVTFTETDLALFMQHTQQEKPKKRKKQVVVHILNLAIGRYLMEATERLDALFQQEAPSKVVVPKTVKPANEAPLKKELYDAKNAMKQLEAEQAQLKKQIKELQQQQEGLQQRLAAAQLQNTALQEQLAQTTAQETLTPNAKELVKELAFLTQELTAELGLVEEVVCAEESIADTEEEAQQEAPAKPNYVDQIKHLKLAIIGGHAKYHTNIKNTLKQDVFTISPDRLNSDVSKLLNYDVLIFITSYNNHNLYNRSFDYVKKHQAKDRCLILNTQPSPKRLAQQIYEFMIQKEIVQ